MEEEWRPLLRDALINMPEVGSVLVAPFQKSFDLRLFVRARGAEEFAGDDVLTKRPFVPVRRSRIGQRSAKRGCTGRWQGTHAPLDL